MSNYNSDYLISLCIPTNGIIEWVFPVLNSIYNQNVSENVFEVVVSNNGNDDSFDKMMKEFSSKHNNLVYVKNDSYMFYNQLEALKNANGMYLKLVNHRNIFIPGSLKQMIDFLNDNKNDKPIIYFSNGSLKQKNDIIQVDSFDLFVRNLKRLVSWTTGVGIWKKDYDEICNELIVDDISPHSCILFSKRNEGKYIINDFIFAEDIVKGHENKGKYDLFKAFAIEEPGIVLKLYCDHSISIKTLKIIMLDYQKFVAELYCDFVILRKKCSYDLSGFNDSMGIFFKKNRIKFLAYLCLIKKILKKLMFWRRK